MHYQVVALFREWVCVCPESSHCSLVIHYCDE